MSLANTAVQFASPPYSSPGYDPSIATLPVAASAGRGVVTVDLALRHDAFFKGIDAVAAVLRETLSDCSGGAA